MRRLFAALAVLTFLLAGCASHNVATRRAPAAPPSCKPPPGGRCSADVPWPGPITISADGRRLYGIINCGGTLHVVSQSVDRVAVRLHVRATRPGSMSCARVDVAAHLTAPLDHRPVYDAVSGRRLPVVVAPN